MADTNYNQNNQYLACKSINRKVTVRVDLLNENFDKVSSLDCELTGGSLTISNSEMIRRDGTLELISTKELNTDYFKIDLDNYVQVYFIVQSTDDDEIYAEYNMGVYMLNSPETKISDRSLSINICDLMKKYDGSFGGGVPAKITFDADTDLDTVIKSIATDSELMGLTKTKIESNDFIIPSDQEFSADTNITDMLKTLKDLYMNTEMYFDENGYFCYNTIKNKYSDSPIYTFDNDDNYIDITYKKNFENVKNSVKVWGSVNQGSTDETEPYQYVYEAKNETGTPFSIDKIKVRRTSISNDKAQSVESCKSEAEYNLESYSNMAETISMEIVPIYYLMPNRIIEINYSNDEIEIEGKWCIDSVNFDFATDGIQTIEAHKVYKPL